MRMRWMCHGAAALLLGLTIPFVSFADEELAKPTEPSETQNAAPDPVTSQANASSAAAASIAESMIDDAHVDHVLKKVTESLDTSTLSEEAKSQIVDGVRRGLRSGLRTTIRIGDAKVDSDGSIKNADRTTIALADGVFIDVNGKQHRIDLKSIGSLIDIGGNLSRSDDLRKRIAEVMSGVDGARAALDQGTATLVGELRRKRHTIGIALRPSSDGPLPKALEAAIAADPKVAEFLAVQGTLEVETVFQDSPAEKAGLKAGDILVSIDDKPLEKASDVIERIREAGEAGRSVIVNWTRNGESLSAEIKPTDQPVLSPMEATVHVRTTIDPSAAIDSDVRVLSLKEADGAAGRQVKSPEIGELKKEVESLRNEIKELKDLIKAGQ